MEQQSSDPINQCRNKQENFIIKKPNTKKYYALIM